MQKVISEWFKVLAPGAKVAMVVSYLGEIIMPSDEEKESWTIDQITKSEFKRKLYYLQNLLI